MTLIPTRPFCTLKHKFSTFLSKTSDSKGTTLIIKQFTLGCRSAYMQGIVRNVANC